MCMTMYVLYNIQRYIYLWSILHISLNVIIDMLFTALIYTHVLGSSIGPTQLSVVID